MEFAHSGNIGTFSSAKWVGLPIKHMIKADSFGIKPSEEGSTQLMFMTRHSATLLKCCFNLPK